MCPTAAITTVAVNTALKQITLSTLFLDWVYVLPGCRFGQLQAVDVAGVSPAVHARDEGNVLRADEPAVYPNRCVGVDRVGVLGGGEGGGMGPAVHARDGVRGDSIPQSMPGTKAMCRGPKILLYTSTGKG